MRMLLTISATVTALAATSAIAAEPAEARFEHEGYTYVYKAEQVDGRKVITGRRYPGNTPFHLVVSGKTVRGSANGTPVSFKLSEVRRLNRTTGIAMR